MDAHMGVLAINTYSTDSIPLIYTPHLQILSLQYTHLIHTRCTPTINTYSADSVPLIYTTHL